MLGTRACGMPDLIPPQRPPQRRCQLRTMLCPAGPGGVMPVKRINDVTLTAIAPTTEKMACQVADGIANCAIPCVAL